MFPYTFVNRKENTCYYVWTPIIYKMAYKRSKKQHNTYNDFNNFYIFHIKIY